MLKNVNGGVKKKTLSLLLPYITTGFLILLLKGYYGYWFLFSLWELSMIAIVFNKLLPLLNKNNKMLIDVIIILGVYAIFRILQKHLDVENPVCEPFKFVGYMIPFFWGYLMRKYDKFQSFLEDKYSWYIVLYVMLFLIQYINYSIESPLMKFLYLIRGFALPIVGSLMVLDIFKKLTEPKIKHWFNLLGRNSIEIYILHLFFVFQSPFIGMFWLTTNTPSCLSLQLIYSLVVSIVAIIISLFLGTILKKGEIISKLLFGK